MMGSVDDVLCGDYGFELLVVQQPCNFDVWCYELCCNWCRGIGCDICWL